MIVEKTTNASYLRFRDWYVRPAYFRSHASRAMQEFYHQCFAFQSWRHPNSTAVLQAVGDARRPFLSTTARERYYKNYSYYRKLSSIGAGKDVDPIPSGKQRIQCDVCDNREDLSLEINECTLEGAGWYLGPTQTLCPEHNEEQS